MNPCLIIDGKMPIQTIQEMYEYLVQCPLQFLYSPTIKEFIDPEFIRVTNDKMTTSRRVDLKSKGHEVILTLLSPVQSGFLRGKDEILVGKWIGQI